MMQSLLARIALAMPLLIGTARAQQPKASGADAARVAHFAADVDALRRELGIPGLSAAIVRDQQLIWSTGFGLSDVEHKVAATPSTPYEVASLSKTFASVLLMQLVEQGKLDLDTPMARFSTHFTSDSVTVRHIFTHTSQGVPGTSYQYNGNIYENLSDVVKSVTGKRYREVLSRNILEPIGATGSSPGNDLAADQAPLRDLMGAEPFARYVAALGALAKPYRLYGDETVATLETIFGIGAANGVVSTVLDLARFDAAIDRHQLLKPETEALAWTNAKTPSGESLPYGLGWMVQQVNGVRTVWHHGYLPDRYSALYLKVPERGVSLVLLANSDALSAPFALGTGDIRTSAFACAFLERFVFDGARTADAGGCKARSHALVAERREARRTSAHHEIAVDSQVVASLAGRYEQQSGNVLSIVARGTHLIRQSAGNDLEFFPESRSTFFAKRSDVQYAFAPAADGQVTLTIRRDGQELTARRLPSHEQLTQSAATQPLRTLQDTIIDLEKRSWVAWQNHDARYFEQFLSDDHVEIHPNGVVDKATVVAGVRSGCVVSDYAVDHFTMTQLNRETVMLTYHAAQTTRCGGNAAPSPVWVGSVYVWRDHRWRNAMYQHTLASP